MCECRDLVEAFNYVLLNRPSFLFHKVELGSPLENGRVPARVWDRRTRLRLAIVTYIPLDDVLNSKYYREYDPTSKLKWQTFYI